MKIAIHHNSWPSSFSTYWINYCKENNIDYKIVNCFNTDIIENLQDCDALMWHHSHDTFEDTLVAKKILFAIEQSGKKVFPDFNTGWHFDDKIAQKYLLEAVNAPLVPSYVFYDKKQALDWIDTTVFPKVFKLKGGSGSKNVQLVRTKTQAKAFTNQAFGKGFSQFNRLNNFQNYLARYKRTKETKNLIKAFGGLLVKSRYGRMQHNERGYLYFQDFIPRNKTDFRIKVVDGKCWGFQRSVRKNDFRASGSGEFIFDNSKIPLDMVNLALKTSEQLGLQSVAFDFLLKGEQPLIVEMSYGFGIDEAEFNFGYWDKNLKLHDEKFNPFGWMVEKIINEG